MSVFTRGKEQDMGRGNGSGAEIRPVPAATMAKNSAEAASTVGPDMIITGTVVSQGSIRILGRVMGDVQAAQVVIGDGARVEGNIIAREVGVNGAFKGTIRGNAVKLRGAAEVEGEVYTNSLAVEENVKFEGVSRRLDKQVELPSVQPRQSSQASQTNGESAPVAEPVAEIAPAPQAVN